MQPDALMFMFCFLFFNNFVELSKVFIDLVKERFQKHKGGRLQHETVLDLNWSHITSQERV